MRHDLQVDGFAFRLRPVEMSDAEFIVELRTGDPSRVRYLHSISPDLEAQRQWLAEYFLRAGDYYWVIERIGNGCAEGLVGVYDFDEGPRWAEWGRWVLRSQSLAAVESALLVYRVAFEHMELIQLDCVTVAENQSVLSFHDSCGLPRIALEKGQIELADGSFDGVRHQCDRSLYPQVVERLEPQAKRIQARLSR